MRLNAFNVTMVSFPVATPSAHSLTMGHFLGSDKFKALIKAYRVAKIHYLSVSVSDPILPVDDAQNLGDKVAVVIDCELEQFSSITEVNLRQSPQVRYLKLNRPNKVSTYRKIPFSSNTVSTDTLLLNTTQALSPNDFVTSIIGGTCSSMPMRILFSTDSTATTGNFKYMITATIALSLSGLTLDTTKKDIDPLLDDPDNYWAHTVFDDTLDPTNTLSDEEC